MPKGTGWLLVALVVALGAFGAWRFYDAQVRAPRTSAEAESKRISAAEGTRNSGSPTGGAQGFSPQQFGSWGSKPPEQQFEANELIVSDPPQAFTASIAGLGYTVVESTRLNNLGISMYRLRIPAGTTVEEARRSLAASYPGIVLDANHHYQPQGGPGEFSAKLPRALAGWSAAKAGCGAGIRLGMIDAAVDVNHPALKGQDVEFRSFNRGGTRTGTPDHGTAVAAIMVGRPEWGGLLPGATLKAGNMFETNEVGREVGSAVGLVKSIDWLLGEKLHVINFSVAGSDNTVVRGVIDKVKAKNLIMVAAAGNWGTDQRPAYPAAYSEVIAVTAFGEKGVQYSHANFGTYIDFAAPGVDVYVAAPGGTGKIESGTSFASPFISVLSALEVARGRADDITALQKLFTQTLIDLGPQGKDKLFGWGFVAKQPAC